jgi:hypothetical protein
MTVRFCTPPTESSHNLLPTDITYASLAKSFDQTLVHHAETLRRMEAMSKTRKWNAHQNAEQRAAYQRMALFPNKGEIIFVGTDIWVVSPFSKHYSCISHTCESRSCAWRGNCAFFRESQAYSKECSPALPRSYHCRLKVNGH